MSITRAQVETVLVRRAGRRMTFVDFSTTTDGTNADLADPISHALLAMNIEPADFTNPVDGDLLTVSSVPELLDRAELRLLQNILGNMDTVNISVDGRSESYSQIGASLETTIERLQTKIDTDYGGSGNELTAGLITLNFTTKGDDTVIY